MSAFTTFIVILSFCAVSCAVAWRYRLGIIGSARGMPAYEWRLPEIFGTGLLIGFFVFVAVAGAGRTPGPIGMEQLISSLALYGGLVLLVLGFLVFRGANLVALFGLAWTGWRRGMFFVVAALLLVLPFVYAAQWIGFQLGGAKSELQPVLTFLLETPGWQGRLAVALIAIVAAPITEELIFRGCLYPILKQFGGRYSALVISSVLFALIHAHLPSLGGLFVLALCLALVFEYTGSLWAPILMHALFNGITVGIALLAPDIIQ